MELSTNSKILSSLAAIMLFFLLLAPFAEAEEDRDLIKSGLPELLNVTNSGTNYWFTIPPSFQYSKSENNYVRIYVTSAENTLVTVESPNKILKQNVTPYEVVEFDLKAEDAQPYIKSGHSSEVVERVFPKKGVHIYADQSLIVYVLVDFHTTSDGFLALPVSSLGTEYMVSSYGDGSHVDEIWNSLPSLSGVVAAYDNTILRFTLYGEPGNQTAGGLKPGETIEVALNKGDVWMVSSGGNSSDLSGSRIKANKPIGVVSGNQCANIPIDNRLCDYIVEMDIPVSTWSNFYHTFSIPGRKYSSILRVYAAYPETSIWRNDSLIAQLDEPGFLEMRVTEDSIPGISAVHADKPIAVTLYNTSEAEDGAPRPNLATFQMTLVPNQQYQKEYTFYIPGVKDEPVFPKNIVSVIFESDARDEVPDDLEIARIVDGPLSWKKVKYEFDLSSMANYSYDLKGKIYSLINIDFDKADIYKIRADRPFAIYSYGFTNYESYGFPAGLNLVNLQTVDTIPPDPSWIQYCNGSVSGKVQDWPEQDGSYIADVQKIVHNYTFIDWQEHPESRSATWGLVVVNPDSDAYAILKFSDKHSNDTTIRIDYFALKLTAEPEFVDFGLIQKGKSDSKKFNIKNKSETSTVTLSQIKLKSGNQGFTLEIPEEDIILGPQEETEITVHFDAAENGIFTDSVGIGDSCIFFYDAELRAEVGGPEILASDYRFGDIAMDLTATGKIKVENTGISDLHITGWTGPENKSVFNMIVPDELKNVSVTNPYIIKPDDPPLFIQIEYTPQAEISYNDSIVFEANTNRIDNISYLKGRGIKPGLIANSVDFGRKRIYRDNFPAGPYIDYITLENIGSQAVTISDYTIIDEINKEAFTIKDSDIKGIQIPVDGSVQVEVQFKPLTTGFHYLRIQYENDIGSKTETIIQGTGIVPRIKAEDVDFGVTVVNDDNSINSRVVRITNLSREDWEYADELNISDFADIPDGAISDDISFFGSKGFRYDGSQYAFDIKLQPGEYVDINMEFHSSVTDNVSAGLDILSDAENDALMTLTGKGIAHGILLKTDSTNICFGEKGTINCLVENYGSEDVNIQPPVLIQDGSDFKIADPQLADGFILKKQDSKNIEINFNPFSEGRKEARLRINTDGLSLLSEETEIVGRSVIIRRNLTAAPALQHIKPGKVALNTLYLDDGTSLSKAKITSFNVQITYNPDFIKYVKDAFVYGDLLKDKFIMEGQSQIDESKGTVNFRFISVNNEYLDGHGPLFDIGFETFLPPDSDDISNIDYKLFAEGNLCADLTSRNSRIVIDKICAENISKLRYSEFKYSLNTINPNPVTNNNTELSYSVGLDGYIIINIYDISGRIIKTVKDGYSEAGDYLLNINLEDIPSGSYYIRMVSGEFVSVKSLYIAD